jgi:hypothetical protein
MKRLLLLSFLLAVLLISANAQTVSPTPDRNKPVKETVYEQLLTLRDQAFAMYDKIIKIQTEMIDRLTAQLNKPQSAWQKFVRVVEKIVVFAAGAAIGRGL